MSRSNQINIKNPSNRWYEWAGKKGQLKYYDKENEKEVYIDLPFHFLVLDELHTITGFDRRENTGYRANEVRDVRNDILVVRNNSGHIVREGVYSEVKTISAVKYAKSIYIAYYEGKELQIGNIKASGAFSSQWIEFTKMNDVYKTAVSIPQADFVEGEIDYYEPVFVTKKVSDETENKALELDKELQEYLSHYLKQPVAESTPQKNEFEEEKVVAVGASEQQNPNEWSGRNEVGDESIPF